MQRSFPGIIAFSMRLYRWLLHMGPADYRALYAEPTLQVARQCCLDAYARRGTVGVLALWLPLFSEALTGMLAEHFSAERMKRMLPPMRRSILLTFVAFALFGIAYVFLMHIIDPAPPFQAVARRHADIQLAYSAIQGGAVVAFLAIVLGGLPILFAAFKSALARSQGHPLALFAVRPKQLLILLGLTLALEIGFFVFLIAAQAIFSGGLPSAPPFSLPPLAVLSQLGLLALFTFVLLAGTAWVARIILRSELSVAMLRYALIPMALAVLAMSVSLVATIVWTVMLWVDAPQFAASQGLGPAGLRGDLGGSEGVIIVVAMMALAAGAAVVALGRGLRARALPAS
ncbi:MAG: hypothetical protein M3Y81_26370 [Chloroflexota bacterium]|nr:hypothetical protein [Chloroflexota bacterium]